MKELTFRKGKKIKIGKRRGFESQLDKNIAKDNCADSQRQNGTLCSSYPLGSLFPYRIFS
jgi:hypothetical protein